jgi:DNA sulfur modification protein DndB
MLGARATTKAERVAEFKKRKQRFAQRKIHPADREKALAEGWTETGRQYKDGQVQVEKSKSHDEILENRFWSVLYHLGYDELNVGRKFKIQITDTNNGEEVSKQVDVFAKDDAPRSKILKAIRSPRSVQKSEAIRRTTSWSRLSGCCQ